MYATASLRILRRIAMRRQTLMTLSVKGDTSVTESYEMRCPGWDEMKLLLGIYRTGHELTL